jgi:hypothetical protein
MARPVNGYGQTFHTKFAMPGRYGKEKSMPRGPKTSLEIGPAGVLGSGKGNDEG